ncbi:helix-turn-helix transcriptional regulator [Rhizobium sp.]|uniref:helix-turn-helix transcriptional regulator n=1 Tax=Rhizobium sp. TaxID=391 RepID=UPI0028A9731F
MERRIDIIALIRAGRALLNISQDDLALMAGVSRSVIARLERNEPSVTLDSIDKIKSALERSGVVFLPPANGLLGAVGLKAHRN